MLQSTSRNARLDASSGSSRAYLARLARIQNEAAASLERAIPEATVSRRFRIVLDGLTVRLPAAQLPRLVRLPGVAKVYPSLSYTPNTNESPSIIGADLLHQQTGAMGDGMKIAVVDTGIDQLNPFLSASGLAMPTGFPKGKREWTTAKVIAARSFPGPRSGRQGRIPVNVSEPHGTHVSGIAAGKAGTFAPAGLGHPAVSGLSGVAPRAWLGNYRVFTVPTPAGYSADSPEIIAAFEAAVRDGMNVINFSGGGPAVDPANDALIEAVSNVVAAGVVPVISAGNDRDEFGLGTAGSPGTAPDAISVAAVSNKHVFAPVLTLDSPPLSPPLPDIPFQPGAGYQIPPQWGTIAKQLVDVGTILGTNRSPVDRRVCGPAQNPEAAVNPLPTGSLSGAIALVSRGNCSFVSKAQRVLEAGAIGMVLVDNRPGEATQIPVPVALPAGMVSDLDGQRLQTALAASSGRGNVRIQTGVQQIDTGRSGIVTYFSSAGPTAFGHLLKPDLAAPGSQILSSVTRAFNSSRFDVFDGTSMAAPHVSGAAALLLQLHPGWTPEEVKSALMSTAGPAWGNTARTEEAPVTLEGAGLVNVMAADDPKLFLDPPSLSFPDLDIGRGAARATRLVTLSDAGGGAGTWQVELHTQSATGGTDVELPSSVVVPAGGGGTTTLSVAATASSSATPGDDYGFVVLRRGADTLRVPYLFLVTRPGLEAVPVKKLHRFQSGSTRPGTSHASVYRFPSWAFGPPPSYTGSAMNDAGAEKLYATLVNRPVANIGVSVIARSPNSLIHPWLLGSRDENDVQGYAGTPVDVNDFTFDYRYDLGAAAAIFPRQKRYYVSVDSGRDQLTGRQYPGRYVLKSWVNDVRPPHLRLLTRRVTVGRPLLLARATDPGSGVDPYSLVLAYGNVLLGAASYDPGSGLVLFSPPRRAPKIPAGRSETVLAASDFQETKNVETVGTNVTPNTAYRRIGLRGVRGPSLTWVAPRSPRCVRGRVPLVALATSTGSVAEVRFLDGAIEFATVRGSHGGFYIAHWHARGAEKGRHMLRAVAIDRSGRRYGVSRQVWVC